MRDRPDDLALLAIVIETLRDDVIPHLAGAPAYQARIAASLVAIVMRGLDRGAADDAAETARLRPLLGDEESDLAGLNRALAARLRNGRLSIDDPDVAGHLLATTLAKLAVDQPGYARYRALASDTP